MPEARKFVLAYHSPKEWTEVRRVQLINLGCSEGYAKKIADSYLVKEKSKRGKKNARMQ